MIVELKNSEIKRQLARENITQNQLAQRLGITSGYMSQLICGTRNPSPKLRLRMMKLFPECDFDDLFIIRTIDQNDNRYL